MKKYVLASLVALGLSNAAMAADPCTGPEVAKNSWLISVNEEDQSSKQDILNVLKLLSKGGFKIGSIFDFSDDADVVLATNFKEDYYADPERADFVKNSVLDELQTLEGVTIRCNGIMRTLPAIGVR